MNFTKMGERGITDFDRNYTELSDIRIPDAICEGTKAVSMLFHSCHNVTKDEFERGEGYLSLMKKNLVSLKEGLN